MCGVNNHAFTKKKNYSLCSIIMLFVMFTHKGSAKHVLCDVQRKYIVSNQY